MFIDSGKSVLVPNAALCDAPDCMSCDTGIYALVSGVFPSVDAFDTVAVPMDLCRCRRLRSTSSRAAMRSTKPRLRPIAIPMVAVWFDLPED